MFSYQKTDRLADVVRPIEDSLAGVYRRILGTSLSRIEELVSPGLYTFVEAGTVINHEALAPRPHRDHSDLYSNQVGAQLASISIFANELSRRVLQRLGYEFGYFDLGAMVPEARALQQLEDSNLVKVISDWHQYTNRRNSLLLNQIAAFDGAQIAKLRFAGCEAPEVLQDAYMLLEGGAHSSYFTIVLSRPELEDLILDDTGGFSVNGSPYFETAPLIIFSEDDIANVGEQLEGSSSVPPELAVFLHHWNTFLLYALQNIPQSLSMALFNLKRDQEKARN